MHRWGSSQSWEDFSSAQRVMPRRPWQQLAKFIGILLALTFLAFSILPWQQSSFGTGRVVAFVPSERRQSIDSPSRDGCRSGMCWKGLR